MGLLALLGVLPGTAQAHNRHFSDHAADYEVNPDTVLVSYSEVPDGIANPDPTPRVRVYGDGRVVIHTPAYMQNAGDREFYLDDTRMQQLLGALQPVFDFDAAEVEQERSDAASLEEQPAGDGMLAGSYSSEEVVADVAIQVEAFTVPGEASRRVDKRLRWKNIDSDARAHPQVTELQDLAALQRLLRELLDGPGATPGAEAGP